MAQTYTPKNILVTGGAGFIGSHVVLHLVKTYPQYHIVNFDVLDYCASTKNVEELNKYPNYTFVQGNILEPDFVRYVISDKKIDTVMHFAAQSHVDNSFGNSIEFTKTNVMGTHILLEAAKNAGIKRFVHVSTDEVYGETGTLQQSQTTASSESASMLNPTNPYAATKAAAELIASAYHKSFKLPVIITRGNNVYGPHQYPEKLIPKFICRLQRQLPCCIHGNGSNCRSFIFVDDVVSAFDTILHKGTVGEIYNIGTEREIEVMTVAKDLINLFGLKDKEGEFLEYVSNRPFNDFRYLISFEKLTSLGWAPKVSWEEGLRRCKEWYTTRDLRAWWPNYEFALHPHPVLKQNLA
jgi:dTDP-glucose 4,6-dehydratase